MKKLFIEILPFLIGAVMYHAGLSLIWTIILTIVISPFVPVNKKTETKEIPYDPQSPLSDKAKKYMEARIENMNISEIKGQPTYNGYTEDEIKYMGLYKN